MACIALMEQTTQPGYVKLLIKPIPPGVDNLQRWVVDAWDLGVSREWQVIASLTNISRLRRRKGKAASTTTAWDTQVDRHCRYVGHINLERCRSDVLSVEFYVAFISRGVPYVLPQES